MRDKLVQRLDRWHDKRGGCEGLARLRASGRRGQVIWPLLISPEGRVPSVADRVFVVANSMREVQPRSICWSVPAPSGSRSRSPLTAPEVGNAAGGQVTDEHRPTALVASVDPISAAAVALDPIADVEANKPKNRSRVGSIRPRRCSTRTAVGATVDLPHLSVMPHGLDAWEPIYARRPGPVGRHRGATTARTGSCSPRLSGGRTAQASVGARGAGSWWRRGCRSGHPRAHIPAVASLHRMQQARSGVVRGVHLRQHQSVPP